MKHLRLILLIMLILSLVALACNFGARQATPAPPTDTPAVAEETPTPDVEPSPVATGTPEPEPTTTPSPTPTEPPPPTRTPLPTQPAPTPRASFDLDTTTYLHVGGLFELRPPRGWTMEETEASVYFDAPDGTGYIYVQVTNTGYALDGPSFERFVTARDWNVFGGYDGYREIDREVDQANGVATIMKQFDFQGVPQTVFSIYDQYGQAIYTIDFWADTDLFEAYSEPYAEILESFTVNSAPVASLEKYLWIYTFTGPGNLFTIEIPTAWTYELSEDPTVIVDTFYSPDDHAVIQNITYDDGTVISRSVAGAFALELLRTYYATDIRITDDRVQPDGSERLTWNSRSGDYSGISFLETRGTTFLLFTIMYDNPYEDVYYDVLDYTVSTYVTP